MHRDAAKLAAFVSRAGLGRFSASPGDVAGHAPIPASQRRLAWFWAVFGLVGFCLAPWYASVDAIWFLAWPDDLYRDASHGAGLREVLQSASPWGATFGSFLLAGALAAHVVPSRDRLARLLVVIGIAGLSGFVLAGAAPAAGAPGWGLGAAMVAATFAIWLAQGLALRGHFGGDVFVSGTVVVAGVLTAVFTLLPVAAIFRYALQDTAGFFSLPALGARLLDASLWSGACLTSRGACGAAWNTLALALVSGALCTLVGFVLALFVARATSGLRHVVRAAAMLPIVAPPFVIGMAMVLLFGRSGLVNALLDAAFGVPPERWIYGLQGVLLAQVFAFTPVAFLVLLGVVEGVSPTLEEAAQTLGADRTRTFFDVSLPLMRPGLAGAFLICFVESITDFGNPIVLGGNARFLATEVFFSLIGAEMDPGRAAALSALLLGLALVAFTVQRRVLGAADYTTTTGRHSRGMHPPLPAGVRRVCATVAAMWCAAVALVFALVLVGGGVVNWGRDFTPTLKHYAAAFGVQLSARGIALVGTAWDSLFETVGLALVVAPLTALIGLLLAWILMRHDFRGRRAFEFATFLALAIPGTVTGVAYLLCFNAPPLELTGTGSIIALCFLFRNLPVAVRGGAASMAQIDRSLDDASVTLGARGIHTFRKIVLPLLRPALIGTWTYGFVRSLTTVSAVIFLVSADHELATTFILNRVINGDYGVAVAYSTVLIALSAALFVLLQRAAGLGRRRDAAAIGPTLPIGAS
ncbi:MAG: ABC transporter permease [Sulfurifustaceae bacterium]